MTIDTIFAAGKENCCGCGTCTLVCPVNAIQMVPEELGCLYPQIDRSRCLDCGKCLKACALYHRVAGESAVKEVFAAAACDAELLKESASGGVFAAVAKCVLEQNGAVFGCSLELRNNLLTPMHICVEDPKELAKLQGSKYVQSDLGDSFVQAKQLLEQGRTVLFSGTPCQIDALNRFLSETDTRNLYTVDIICHGVPSAQLFQGYLKTLGASVRSFSFRDKTRGWGLNGRYTYRTGDQEREKLFSPSVSSYYSYFLQAETYRESCYSCRYANLDRVGDITIGDFWGFEQEHPELLAEHGGPYDIRRGISEVLVNTRKGKCLLKQFGQGMQLSASETGRMTKWNRQLCGPSACSEERKAITKVYEKNGYPGVESMFRKELGIRLWARKLKAFLYRPQKNKY